MGIAHAVSQKLLNGYILTWDALLAMINLVLPKRPVGKVTPKGHPGFGGKWPEYVAPGDGDSRCSCPAINAMANHGILPHDGKNIKFTELTDSIRATYNFAPTFCLFVPNFAAEYLKKNYHKDTFDLAEIDLHNAIEHDGSLVREDAAIQPDQGKIATPLVEQLLSHVTGKDAEGKPLLLPSDLAAALTTRRADARATNPQFTTSFGHRLFGASNASTLLTIFGGKVDDLRTILLEERLPEGWESRIRNPFGLTMTAFNFTVFGVTSKVKNLPPTPGLKPHTE